MENTTNDILQNEQPEIQIKTRKPRERKILDMRAYHREYYHQKLREKMLKPVEEWKTNGRPPKYASEEEREQAYRQKLKEYYEKNKMKLQE